MPDPVQVELPVPFPLGTVNVWLFGGAEPAMVDCGIGTDAAYAGLLEAAARQEFPISGATIYLTHGHVDHVGNGARLRNEHGCQIAAPRVEAPFVETFRADGETRNDQFADALRAHGMPEDDVVRMRADSDAIDAYSQDARIDLALDERTTVMLGDMEAKVVRTPGHTPGSTSYLTEDNQLLSGDTLLEDITSNAVELRDADRGNFHQYLDTLDHLRRLVGVECLPGHRAPFRLTDTVLDEHLHRHQQRRREILDALHRPKTAYQLMRYVYPQWHTDPQQFMGMAEVVGHLHALEMDGLLQRQDEQDGGVRRFVRAR